MANTRFSVDGGISTDSLVLSPSETVLGTVSSASVIGGWGTAYVLNTHFNVARNLSSTAGTFEIDIDTTIITNMALQSALLALPQNSGDSSLFLRVTDGSGGGTSTYPIAYSTNTSNGKGYYTYVIYFDAGIYTGTQTGTQSIEIGIAPTYKYITTSSTLDTDLTGKTKFKVGLSSHNTANFTITSTYFEGSASISASVGDLVSSFDESTIGFSALPFGSTSSSVTIGYDPVIAAWKAGTAEVISGKIGRNAQPGGEFGQTNSVGIGLDALQNLAPDSNGGGNYNYAVGYQALQDTNTGFGNIAIGGFAGKKITTGDNNIAIGYATVYQGVTAATGDNNITIGAGASAKITSGEKNIAIGAQSLGDNLTGVNNTAIGTFSGAYALGSRNVYIGYSAGENASGDDKLYISNSGTATPLIYGDFNASALTINGSLTVTGNMTESRDTLIRLYMEVM